MESCSGSQNKVEMVNKSLSEKHTSEETFHDKKAKEGKKADSFYEQGAALKPYLRMLDLAGDLKGKQVLDFGCGTGWASISYAQKGAIVTGFDISEETLNNARTAVKEKGLDHLITLEKGYAEDLKYDKEFDIIIGSAILHHTDIEKVANSVYRVLKPGGRALFMEPLAHNPILKLFRILTPWRRSKTEKPLTIQQINSFKYKFKSVYFEGYTLFSLLSFVFIPIKCHGLFKKSLHLLEEFDSYILERIPFLKRYCWGAIIVLTK